MPESGEGKIKPLNPGIEKELGDIVSATGYDKDPQKKTVEAQPESVDKRGKEKPEPLSLGAQKEIGDIVSKTGFDQSTESVEPLSGESLLQKDILEDTGNEPLLTKERESVRDLYRQIIKVMPIFGLTYDEIKNGIATKPIDMGTGSEWRIKILVERDKKNTEKITKRSVVIQVFNQLHRRREEYRVSSDGTAYCNFPHWKSGQPRIEWLIGKDPATNYGSESGTLRIIRQNAFEPVIKQAEWLVEGEQRIQRIKKVLGDHMTEEQG